MNNHMSDEQLAYLNDNIDLVSEYINARWIGNSFPEYMPLSVTKVDRGRMPEYAYVTLQLPDPTYPARWRELLQFVEDNQPTPPVFK